MRNTTHNMRWVYRPIFLDALSHYHTITLSWTDFQHIKYVMVLYITLYIYYNIYNVKLICFF